MFTFVKQRLFTKTNGGAYLLCISLKSSDIPSVYWCNLVIYHVSQVVLYKVI